MTSSIKCFSIGFEAVPFPIQSESEDIISNDTYLAKMTLSQNSLFICTTNGVYQKDLNDNSNWCLRHLSGLNILQFIENEEAVLALVKGNDNSNSIVRYDKKSRETSNLSIYQDKTGNFTWLAQNPFNPYEIVVDNNGEKRNRISKDFGNTWTESTIYFCGDENLCFEYSGVKQNIFYTTLSIRDIDESIFYILNLDNGNRNLDIARFSYYATYSGEKSYNAQLFSCKKIRSCTFSSNAKERIWIAGDGILAVHLENNNSIDFEATHFPDFWRTNTYFVRVLLDENNPDIAYAPGIEKDGDATNLVIYKSTDSGINWSKIASEELDDSRSRLLDNVMYDNKILMYLNGNRLIEFDLNSVAGIADDIVPTDDSGAEYYNLQGIKVENPEHGIHIKKQGNKSEKIVM